MRHATAATMVMVVTLALEGCAAIPVAALGASAFNAGANAVEAGQAYTRGGVVYRTFTLALDELRLVLGDTLARMEIAVVTDSEGHFGKDRATASEIVAQTERAVEARVAAAEARAAADARAAASARVQRRK